MMQIDDPLDASKRRRGKEHKADAVQQLRGALGKLAYVERPQDAQEPILAPNVRAVLFAWLRELNLARELQTVGLQPRSRALLYGPPGTGKTTLAHHVSARLGLPMVLLGAETVTGMFHGESEKNLAKIFNTLAEIDVPAVVFIDEIDALGGSRDKYTGGGGADNARRNTLTVMLRLIERHKGLVFGATNRKEDIDPALWRRFDLQISVDLPDDDCRYAILARYAEPYVFDEASLDILTDMTAGASPDLLRGLMEGMKRALVVWPAIKRRIDSPEAVFDAIAASVTPPPELEGELPPLWRRQSYRDADRLAQLSWPPKRREEAA